MLNIQGTYQYKLKYVFYLEVIRYNITIILTLGSINLYINIAWSCTLQRRC